MNEGLRIGYSICYLNESITRSIAGCLRFFTLTQSFDRPLRANQGHVRNWPSIMLALAAIVLPTPPVTASSSSSRKTATSQLPCGGSLSRAISFSRATMSIFDCSSPKGQCGSAPLIKNKMSDRFADDRGHESKTWKLKNPASARRSRDNACSGHNHHA